MRIENICFMTFSNFIEGNRFSFIRTKKHAVSQSKRKIYYNFYVIIFLLKVSVFDRVKTWKIAIQTMKYALSGCEISSLTLQNKPSYTMNNYRILCKK